MFNALTQSTDSHKVNQQLSNINPSTPQSYSDSRVTPDWMLSRADWFGYFHGLRREGVSSRAQLLREMEASRAMLLPWATKGFSYRQVQGLLQRQESLVRWDMFLDQLLMLRPETPAVTVLKDSTLLVDCSLTKEWCVEELVGTGELGCVRALSLFGMRSHPELPTALTEGLVILNASGCNAAELPIMRNLMFLNVSASGLASIKFVNERSFP